MCMPLTPGGRLPTMVRWCDVSCLAPTTCWEVDTTVLHWLYGTNHRWELADDVRLPTMVRRCDVSCLSPTPGGRLI